MILTDRWDEILNFLRAKKFATVEELMNQFNISRSTLRRDLIAMESKKLLLRTRGGAEIAQEAGNNDLDYNLDSVFMKNRSQKIKIAKRAAQLLKDNEVIFIDSGSTCYYMIDFIEAENITVVTNGIKHIEKLMSKGIKTYILGGYSNVEQNLIVGEDTVNKVSLMNFDKAFLGTMGIDNIAGFTTSLLYDGDVKRSVIKSSEECYVLADSSKFNIRKFYTYGCFTDAKVISDYEGKYDDSKLNIIHV